MACLLGALILEGHSKPETLKPKPKLQKPYRLCNLWVGLLSSKPLVATSAHVRNATGRALYRKPQTLQCSPCILNPKILMSLKLAQPSTPNSQFRELGASFEIF